MCAPGPPTACHALPPSSGITFPSLSLRASSPPSICFRYIDYWLPLSRQKQPEKGRTDERDGRTERAGEHDSTKKFGITLRKRYDTRSEARERDTPRINPVKYRPLLSTALSVKPCDDKCPFGAAHLLTSPLLSCVSRPFVSSLLSLPVPESRPSRAELSLSIQLSAFWTHSSSSSSY